MFFPPPAKTAARSLQLLVHHQGIDKPEPRVLECARQPADDFEAVCTPDRDGADGVAILAPTIEQSFDLSGVIQ